MGRIAIIGSRTDMARHAKELGLDVVLVHNPGSPPERVAQYLDQSICCPVTDLDAIFDVLKPLHRSSPFSRILAPGEDGVLAAAVVSEKLGIEGNSVDTVVTLKNKILTRRVLERRGISPVQHRQVASVDEVVEFLAEVNDRIILKPIDSTGSLATLPIDGLPDARRAWQIFTESGHTEGLVEEFLVGPEVSMESFTVAGEHFPVAIDEYVKDGYHFIEIGDVLPGRVSAQHQEEMQKLTVELLDAVGLTEGPAHTEFILTPQGPRILESHSRIGGGGIHELVRRAYNVDLSCLQVSVPLGLETFTPHSLESGRGAALIFFTPKPGLVTNISGLDELNLPVNQTHIESAWTGLAGLDPIRDAEVGVNLCLKIGDIAPEVRSNWDLLMGCVLASGRDADDAASRAEEVMGRIKIETEPMD